MGSVTAKDLHVDQVLSQFALDYRPDGMIADLIFPVVDVVKQSDFYAVFSRADALRIEDTARAPGTMANKISRGMSSGTYFAKNYALDYPIVLEDRENMDQLFLQKIYNGRVAYLMDKLMLDWENRIASKVTSGSNVGSYSAVGSSWSDLDNSDPISDINNMLDNVRDSTGKRPNNLVMGETAYRLARRNAAVRNLIFGSNNGGGFASRAQLADLFEVDQVLVGGAYKNTGNEAQAESLVQVWGPNVLAYYAPSAPSMDVPSFGYSIRWNRPGLPNMQVERHPFDTRRKAEDIEVGYYQDEKITGAEYGFLLLAVNSST